MTKEEAIKDAARNICTWIEDTADNPIALKIEEIPDLSDDDVDNIVDETIGALCAAVDQLFKRFITEYGDE